MSRGEPGDRPVGGVFVELGRCERDPARAAPGGLDVGRPGRRGSDGRIEPEFDRAPVRTDDRERTAESRPGRRPVGAERGLDVVEMSDFVDEDLLQVQPATATAARIAVEVVAMSLVVGPRLVIDGL